MYCSISAGGFVAIKGTPVAWISQMQAHGVALHVFEAEYFAMLTIILMTAAILQILEAWMVVEAPITLCGDNIHVIEKTRAGRIYGLKSLRHVRTAFGFIYEQLLRGVMCLAYAPSAENIADIFIKALPTHVHLRHTAALNIS